MAIEDNKDKDPSKNGDPAKDVDPNKDKDPTKGEPNNKGESDKKGEPDQSDKKVEFKIGDSTKQQVQVAIESAGYEVDKLFDQVKANNGMVPLDVAQALIEEHGETLGKILIDNIAGLHKENVTAASARDQEVFDYLKDEFKDVTEQSGEETWKELSGWAKDNVDQQTRDEINELLAKGGFAAKLALKELVEAFRESEASGTRDADLMEGDNTSTTVNGGDISKADYNAELRKLMDAGEDYDTSPKIKALQQRRQRSIARNIR